MPRSSRVIKTLNISGLITNFPSTNYATSLRGLAAVSVVAIHAGAARPLLESSTISEIFGGGITRFVELGAAGPAVFFICSGFVLSLVWQKSRNLGFISFSLRRFLRLSPLYFIVLSYLYILGSLELSDFALRMLFLDAFLPAVFARDPIGILWTLSVEFWCSLLVPLFVITLRSKFKLIWLTFYFFISVFSPKLLIELGSTELMAYKSIPSAVFCFAIGVYLSGLNPSSGEGEGFKIMTVFSIGFLFMYLAGGYMGAWWISILLTVSFLGYRRTKLIQPKSNPFMLFLGTICYGIYLLHIPILARVLELSSTFAFYLTFPVTLVAAAISWKFVERPIISKSKR